MSPAELEARIMGALGLASFPVATQTAPRKQEFRVLSGLASLGQTLYKFAADLRLLQSPPIGEWAEPFGARQIGSSAMPFKRNPIHAENMDSLARMLAALPRVAWDNAAHNYLERTLDDSANRRSLLPEAFLLADELLSRGARLISGLVVDRGASARLLATYGPFAATERVLMQVARRGADRQEMHEVIRERSMEAWAALKAGLPNPLTDAVCAEVRLLTWASADELRGWMDAGGYVGDAPARCGALVGAVRGQLNELAAWGTG
jgi:adenylosuccinate lyase